MLDPKPRVGRVRQETRRQNVPVSDADPSYLDRMKSTRAQCVCVCERESE